MTGAVHLAEEIHLPAQCDQLLAIARIGKMSRSRSSIPLRESQSDL